MSTRVKMALLCAAAALSLASCGKKAPEGQVVAQLNGQDVTLQELNAELQGANIPPSMDKKLVMQQILQRVIDRKLLGSAAQEQGIDKSADYLAQRRRADETLLVQLYAKQQSQALAVPTPADISKFMADNPNMFAKRERMALDQIRFPRTEDTSVLKALEAAHSMDQVAQVLTAHNVKFQRGTTAVDSATVPANILSQIEGLPAGEPFVVPGPQFVAVSVVTGHTPVAVPDAQARTIAVNAWREQQFEKIMSDKLKALRSAAKITYQPGFEPPAEGAKGAKGAAKPGAAPAAAVPAATPGPSENVAARAAEVANAF